MPWSAPNEAEVLTEFTPEESTILQRLQGATDNLPAIVARVVAEIRDAIRSGGYALDEDATRLPLGLHGDAVALARWKWLISTPKLPTLQTDARKAEAEDAREKLKLIAAQKWSPEPPSAPTSASAAARWNSERPLLSRTHPVPAASEQLPNQPSFYANPEAPDNL